MNKVLVIDDESSQREILYDILTDAGYKVDLALNGEDGINKLSKLNYNIVITDIRMPKKSGMEVLDEIVSHYPHIQVILMTAYGSIPSAVNAIKSGAYDYLTKPFNKSSLLQVVKNADEKSNLIQENRTLKEQIINLYSYHQLIGGSRAMNKIYDLIDKLKNIDTTVLITGDSGTGKELVAKAIHFSGIKKDQPFIPVNCGAIPENLIESELFGHTKGSFTGAVQNYIGKFEQANNGTLFLDEISTMPFHLQSRLLRVIQEKQVEKIGDNKSKKLNLRIIAATNENLLEKVEKKQFREDLFHRLNVISIHLPTLNERKEDITLLVKHFIKKFAKKYNRNKITISSSALSLLENHNFSGNIRELENIIEKSIIFSNSDELTSGNLMLQKNDILKPDTQLSLPELEKQKIKEALKKSNGSIKRAAQILGITYKTLQYRIKKYQIIK